MNVLTKPEVTPDMLYAVVRFVAESETTPERDDLVSWFYPGRADDAGEHAKAVADLKSIESCGQELGFFSKGWRKKGEALKGWHSFAERLHESFVNASPSNRAVLDIYAAMVVLVESRGLSWLCGTVKTVTEDHLKGVVSKPDEVGAKLDTNSTQWDSWKRWVTALGLGYDGTGKVKFVPHPAERLRLEVLGMPTLREGKVMKADEFMGSLAVRLPYLDGGNRYDATLKRAGVGRDPKARVSRVLSNALRDLHRTKVLRLEYEGGDRPYGKTLADDGAEPTSFATVRLAQSVEGGTDNG